MNKILVFSLIIILIVVSFSCDGSDRVYKTNKEILTETKLLDAFAENIKYFPETYTEVETDTILSNGFRVKIKIYSDMNSSVLTEYSEDTITHKRFYREFISDIIVHYQNREIFKKKITTDYILDNSEEAKVFIEKKAILKNVRLTDQINKDKVTIELWLWKVDTEIFLPIQLVIDKEGNYSLSTEGELEF